MPRKAELSKKQGSSTYTLALNIDGNGNGSIHTHDDFLNHMLGIFAKEAKFDITLSAKGCSQKVIGEILGEVIKAGLNDSKNVVASCIQTIAHDHKLTVATIELYQNPFFKFEQELKGDVLESYEEFFKAFVQALGCKLHIMIPGEISREDMFPNLFKAFGRALGVSTSKNASAKYRQNRPDIPTADQG